MIINKKYILAFSSLMMLVSLAKAQSTINSPYSKYGVGNLTGSYLLPEQLIFLMNCL